MKWKRHVTRMGERTGAYMVLVVKPEGKRSLRRPRHRLKGNTRGNVKEIFGRVWAGLIWLKVGTSGGLL
jgi:hypothetical protein